MKRLLLILLIASLVVPFAFGQRSFGKPSTYERRVNTNVSGARNMVDGQPIKGNMIKVKPGDYTVKVTAKGYFDWQQNVSVKGNVTVDANLKLIEYTLQVDSNQSGAQVYINGNSRGNTNMSTQMKPGTYTVRVSKSGYKNWETKVNLNSNQRVYAELQPDYARAKVSFPKGLLNINDKGAAGKIEIYIDGNRQKGNSFNVTPGNHSIKIISGGVSVEQSYNFKPGGNYTIEPSFGLSIK